MCNASPASKRASVTAEQAKRRLIREIEALPDDDDMAQAMRADIRERYHQRESERRALLKELDELKVEAPPTPEDPCLLDALPLIPVTLTGVPDELQHALFDAFALVIQYDQLRREVEVSVALTDRLAQTIRSARDWDDGGAPVGAAARSSLLLSRTLRRG
jgi:site-specific DNA recombinase